MIKGNFDYKHFAESMKKQSKGIIPDDLSNDDAKYTIDKIYDFVLLSGEALHNDDDFEISEENATMLCQLIAEWIYHKCMDLAQKNILQKYWDGILQKIAFTVFEVAKQAILEDMPKDQLIRTVEYHVEKVWEKCIEDIDKKTKEAGDDEGFDYTDSDVQHSGYYSEKASKLEEMYKIPYVQQKHPAALFNITRAVAKITSIVDFFKENKYTSFITNAYGLCWAVIAICIISLCLKLYLHFKEYVPTVFVNCGVMLLILLTFGFIAAIILMNLHANNELKKQEHELEKTREELNELVNPERMYERLGVDEISVTVGTKLLPVADPDQEGTLLANIAALRQRLTDEFGYIIPQVRVMDSAGLDENEYLIAIRSNEVATGYVYPGKYMVYANKWDSLSDEIPDDAIVGVSPVEQAQAYWVTKYDIERVNNSLNKIDAFEPEVVIINHLKEILIRHVYKIMTISSVQKLIDYVCCENEKLVMDLTSNGITEYDLQKIFINLIREKVSIKDILFVFEKLCDFSRNEKIRMYFQNG